MNDFDNLNCKRYFLQNLGDFSSTLKQLKSFQDKKRYLGREFLNQNTFFSPQLQIGYGEQIMVL